MSDHLILRDDPGGALLLNGNEAAARGVLEGAAQMAASYPGSPTVEIMGSLAAVAEEAGIVAEWSINEIVAMEAAAGASLAGLRALVSMKPDGLNVTLDFLTALAYTGVKAGMVIVVGDDCGAHSGVKEEDCRAFLKAAEIPVWEAATVHDAKEMTRAAFDVSEKIGLPVAVRLTTRICHGSGNVTLGELPPRERKADIGPEERFLTLGMFHAAVKKRLAAVKGLHEQSPFNVYAGPEGVKKLVIATGVCALHAAEAIRLLGLSGEVGLLRLGTSFPLPDELLAKALAPAAEVVFVEETAGFVEESVMAWTALHMSEIGMTRFRGKMDGTVAGPHGPGVGEMDPDLVINAIQSVFGGERATRRFTDTAAAEKLLDQEMPKREHTFCAGCGHRAGFWAMYRAVDRDGRGAIVLGDIGCYTLALGKTGYGVLRSVHCMGAGVGMATGLGRLGRFDFKRPVVAVLGDSTFYHAGLPAFVEAKHLNADVLLVVLDNHTTAMTGHQPHPGLPTSASGVDAARVGMESLLEGIGLPVTVRDPFDLQATETAVYDLLQQTGPRVLILRQPCALQAAREKTKTVLRVDPERCAGCGLCSRKFACPGTVWDDATNKARIDETLCNGCGVCAQLCPAGAIAAAELVPEGGA